MKGTDGSVGVSVTSSGSVVLLLRPRKRERVVGSDDCLYCNNTNTSSELQNITTSTPRTHTQHNTTQHNKMGLRRRPGAANSCTDRVVSCSCRCLHDGGRVSLMTRKCDCVTGSMMAWRSCSVLLSLGAEGASRSVATRER